VKIGAIDALYIAADRTAYGWLGLRSRSFEEGPPTFHVGQGKSAVGLMFGDYKSGVPAGIPVSVRPGLFAVGFRVADVEAMIRHLHDHNVPTSLYQQAPWLTDEDRAGSTIVFSTGSWQRDVGPGHTFALKRLDHLAAVAHNLDSQCRFWEDVLGVPVTGEVRTPTMIIRQLRIGDAVFELLGPAGPDSPLHQRPAGLVNMAAWEVDDLPAAVAQARAGDAAAPVRLILPPEKCVPPVHLRSHAFPRFTNAHPRPERNAFAAQVVLLFSSFWRTYRRPPASTPMTAGDSPMQTRIIMALAYANLWDERVGMPIFAQRPYPLRW
jgi:catechol 2,3-dioxygenase-like lactoylglutathione lyase family enzyme